MQPSVKWRLIVILLVGVICLYGLVGRPFPKSWAHVKQNLESSIPLGLDLRGGTHMILQVQVEEAVRQHVEQAVGRLRDQLREKSVPFGDVRQLDDTHILAQNIAPEHLPAFRETVTNYFAEWDLVPAAGEPNSYTLALRPSRAAEIRVTTLRQAVETIRRRIDALGLTEPVIAEHGRAENEILVQLPGEGDPTRAKAVIQAGGQLELRLVRNERPFSSQAEGLADYGGVLPPATELLPGKPQRTESGSIPPAEVWYLLDRVPVVTGRDLRTATAGPSDEVPGRYQVNFTLSRDGASRFGPFTEANINKPMAVVLEGRVQNVAIIRSRIDDSGKISEFSQEEARDLALVLRAGALPASIRYLEERTVGPSLGADSIRQGFLASVISLIAVMICMVIYYRLSGVNAVVALILNLIILLAALAFSGAVLTLPGIAGVILTIGMGVDSNVLVFERIREELRAGKAPASAVDAGFSRAFLTIIDTHVTTVVSAIFLFMFGTGPVRGFAVTLVIGLISNLFTAIFVSRTIFLWHLGRLPREAELSI